MDLSIIIVAWQTKEKLKDNLQALYGSRGSFDFEVIVVDNNSNDGTIEMLTNEFSEVKLIANETNLGFAVANNQALKIAQGKFILLLNPDMRLQADTLEKTLTWAKNKPQATVTGCHLVNQAGETIKQVRRFPTLKDQLAVVLKLPHLFSGINKRYLQADFDYSQESQVDSIRGAFFLINREAYKKISQNEEPKLDERYFLWFEEVDFCLTVKERGGQVWYTPVATCLDYVGQSFKQVKRGQTQRYFRDSMLKYFSKWGKKGEVNVLKIAWSLVLFFWPK